MSRWRVFIGLLAALTLGGVGIALRVIVFNAPRVESIGYTELLARGARGEIERAEIQGERVRVVLRGGGIAAAVVSNAESQHAVVAELASKAVPVEFLPHEAGGERLLATLAPLLAIFSMGGLGAIMYRKKRLSHVQKVHESSLLERRVTFADVAGVDEAKNSLTETIEFLREPKTFGRLGGRAPRGILLSGPPGTGKTLLARAAAGEARVPFLSASGSGFQEMFAGVGAARVRTLFAEARKLAPCIVFLDEIDAVGKRRGRGDDSASADADQTLNQLLVEMDGFDATSGIVVLASTNRADILDRALLRPGRFDRQVTVSLPDLAGREQILRVHAAKVVLSAQVDLTLIAKRTPGWSGADLAQLLNEAAILATRVGADAIGWPDVERARDRVLMGDERRSLVLSDDERHATAVHEAGHVAVGLASRWGDPVHKVSILPRGRALGVTESMPDRDRLMYRREYLEDRLAMLLGGRAAEQVILGTMTAGAADDIGKAMDLARRMVGEMGMSALGPVHVAEDPALRSPSTLDRIDRTACRLVRSQLARACAIVEAQRAGIDRLVRVLLERDTLETSEIRACFDDDGCAEQTLHAHHSGLVGVS